MAAVAVTHPIEYDICSRYGFRAREHRSRPGMTGRNAGGHHKRARKCRHEPRLPALRARPVRDAHPRPRAGRRRSRQGEGRRQGDLVHLDADRPGPEDRRRLPEGDRHQGRDVPLRRIGHLAPFPAGDGRRPRRGRRADPFGAGRRQCARQEGAVPRLQAEELRQGAGRRQGPERPVRRPAPQPDDPLPAQRQSRGRGRAEDLGRPAQSRNTRASW